jgi:hypothetical protein
MEIYHCEIHNLDIKVYNHSEEDLFVDDNKQESVIFVDERGNKKLKRCVIGKCDENCPKVQELLK